MKGFLAMLRNIIPFSGFEKRKTEVEILKEESKDLRRERFKAASEFEKSLDDFRRALANRSQVTRQR